MGPAAAAAPIAGAAKGAGGAAAGGIGASLAQSMLMPTLINGMVGGLMGGEKGLMAGLLGGALSGAAGTAMSGGFGKAASSTPSLSESAPKVGASAAGGDLALPKPLPAHSSVGAQPLSLDKGPAGTALADTLAATPSASPYASSAATPSLGAGAKQDPQMAMLDKYFDRMTQMQATNNRSNMISGVAGKIGGGLMSGVGDYMDTKAEGDGITYVEDPARRESSRRRATSRRNRMSLIRQSQVPRIR